MSKKLSELVSVHRNFLRSIRLDTDLGRADAISGYIYSLLQNSYLILQVVIYWSHNRKHLLGQDHMVVESHLLL